MKRVLLVLTMMMLLFSSTLTAFAASVEVDTIVTLAGAWDENGNPIDVIITPWDGGNADEFIGSGQFRNMLGDRYTEDLKVVDTIEYEVVGGKDGENYQLMFNVPGANQDANVQVFQFVNGKWQLLKDIKVGDGTVTLTVDKANGALMFMVDGMEVVDGVEQEGEAVKTGDNSSLGLAVTAFVAAGAVLVYTLSKKRAE